MDYLPICMRLKGSTALLVGGGKVATRKARLLAAAGAHVRVVAPELADELRGLLADSGEWQQRMFAAEDLDGAELVIAATSDAAVNRAVHDAARARALPVNVVDTPELCTFIFPSIVDRGAITVAVTSGGRSPVLTRQIRRRIEVMLPAATGRLAEFAVRLRDTVRDAIPGETPRRLFWERIIDGSTAELVLAGNEARAETELREQLEDTSDLERGEVYLVGAGPGDPDLLTFKALRLLQSADAVLYDRLVADEIVALARRDAEMIYVGKRRADHSVPQPEINQLLVDLALQGKRVIRLKGGDPFIFGRGGEEIELLAQHGISFQVVPGITAASGAAAYGGIPLTHRDHAQSVRFITGNTAADDGAMDWSQLRSSNETLVFYMGLTHLSRICERLLENGHSPETPLALVERASTPTQRVHVGTLETMPAIAEREQPRAPTLIIVGGVVTLCKELAWFRQDSDH